MHPTIRYVFFCAFIITTIFCSILSINEIRKLSSDDGHDHQGAYTSQVSRYFGEANPLDIQLFELETRDNHLSSNVWKCVVQVLEMPEDCKVMTFPVLLEGFGVTPENLSKLYEKNEGFLGKLL